jgi:hypothetical protein
VAGGSAALATVFPVTRLNHLEFHSIRSSDLGFHWGTNAATPASAQAQSIDLLYQLLLTAAGCTLLLAIISILSISAARASARAPEISVRRAAGASRVSLRRAALLEGGVLTAVALMVGISAGIFSLLVARRTWPGTVGVGPATFSVAAVLVIVVAIIVGALFQLLAATTRRIAEPNPRPLELHIPALQLGIGLTVLVASTMLVRHATGLVTHSARPDETGLVFPYTVTDTSLRGRAVTNGQIIAQFRADPRVQSVSIMSPGTLVGLGMTDAVTTDCGYCPDGGVIIKWHVVFSTHYFVTADTFRALGIERIEGRLLTDEDRLGSPPVVVISESLARRHFQNGQPLGRQILLKLHGTAWFTVVGVVSDQEPSGFGGQVQPRSAIYLSALQLPPTTVDILVRHRATPAEAISINPPPGTTLDSPVREQALIAREADPLTWFGRWFSLLGWSMLFITAATTFVLMRAWVASLLPELGLHRAVGARRDHLARFILVRAAGTALAGVAIALWFGPALWDSLPEIVAGLPEWNYRIVAPLALILLAIALAGAILPALRAARATPSTLLGSTGE